MRYDVNWQKIRTLIVINGTIVGVLGLTLGFFLIRWGATGEFSVLGEGKGMNFFITSVSPGIFIAATGATVNIVAFRMQRSCLGMPTARQLKARGGLEYYKFVADNPVARSADETPSE